jgi:hypothetical protein
LAARAQRMDMSWGSVSLFKLTEQRKYNKIPSSLRCFVFRDWRHATKDDERRTAVVAVIL